ncbi:GumC family protein [Phorcysia thermohydrogeniphila]|uniref:GumC family protein n=1 Tax=Phorcysia thermohydrogeniphila TaxID=936138 RepID=UPI001403B851|nr:Wzz/FepE/Etk N-terminal domain-containing protein [Phorcysia thermohydrogeniphila]
MKPENLPPETFDDEIDLYELWLTLKRRKKTVIGITVLFTTIALVLCFVLPPTYRTEASLMPLGGEQSSKLSSLLSSLPISIPLPGGQAGITVESVLNSRILRERIVKDLNLLPVLFPDKWDETTESWKLAEDETPPTLIDGAKKLEDFMSVSTDKKTGVVTLTVDFPKDPEMSYRIAITALKEARNILNEKAFTLAKKYRIYVEKQLALAKEKYQELERIYKDFMNGKIKDVPFIIGDHDLEDLKSNVPEKAEIEKLKKEIERLKAHLNTLRKSSYVSVSDYQLNLQKLQTQMEIVKQLLVTLAGEYEMAKAQEMKEQISFQVIDPPYIPPRDKPYKPKKGLIVTVGFVSGLFLGIFAAFFREWLENVKKKREEEKVNA